MGALKGVECSGGLGDVQNLIFFKKRFTRIIEGCGCDQAVMDPIMLNLPSCQTMMDVGDTVVTTNTFEGFVPPVYRVAPEIIVKIVRRLLLEKINYFATVADHIEALLEATSICRHWRYAVLDDAILWSLVPAHLKALGPLFLQRSRNMPLTQSYFTRMPEELVPRIKPQSHCHHTSNASRQFSSLPPLGHWMRSSPPSNFMVHTSTG